MNLDFRPILNDFDLWYEKNHLQQDEDIYNNILTYQNLRTISDDELKTFFSVFVSNGGGIMKPPMQYKFYFKKNMEEKFGRFREFVLMPFTDNLDLKLWFNKNNENKYFGFYTATIYLNRVNKMIFPIYNTDTERAFKELGIEIYKPNSNNYYQYYTKMSKYQRVFLKNCPAIGNFYKLHALLYYLKNTKEGHKFLKNQDGKITKIITDDSIIYAHIENTYISNEELFKKIKKYNKMTISKIKINSVTYKRDSYQMALIKKYHGYKCQFCSTKIMKKNGQFYIEACHITAKAEGGNEDITNILVLCPNCHKLFDMGDKKEIKRSNSKYVVELNGKKYTAFFEMGHTKTKDE